MNNPVKRIMELAELLSASQDNVKRLTDELAAAKAESNRLEREDLPELMRELDFASFTMTDGRTVQVREELTCKIAAANHAKAMRWLDENGFGGLIKTQMKVNFNREDRETALTLAENLSDEAQERDVTIDPVVVENVHNSTLRSFIKEQMAKGNSVPFKLFGVFAYNKATISE